MAGWKPASLCQGKRIFPFQAAEPGEVAIAGDQRGAVRNRERRQVCVGNEVPTSAGGQQQVLDNAPVVLAWIDQAHDGSCQPFVNVLNCLRYAKRLSEQVRMCRDPEEA